VAVGLLDACCTVEAFVTTPHPLMPKEMNTRVIAPNIDRQFRRREGRPNRKMQASAVPPVANHQREAGCAGGALVATAYPVAAPTYSGRVTNPVEPLFAEKVTLVLVVLRVLLNPQARPAGAERIPLALV
jgi:hypothetical protein